MTKLLKAYATYVTKGLRKGQAFMNALQDTHPSVYEEVTGTGNDCFYDDSRFDSCVEFVTNHPDLRSK